MKVLWLENTTPSRYHCNKTHLNGWQDALENTIGDNKQIDLTVAFRTAIKSELKVVDNIKYVPYFYKLSLIDRILRLFSWKVEQNYELRECLKIINKINPDIIHIFGTEYPYGLLASYTKIPVVVHIQGSIVAYANSDYPPGYNLETYILKMWPNIIKQMYSFIKDHKQESRVRMEYEIWKSVSYFMGRTRWDRALTMVLNPNARYFTVNEALRDQFISTSKLWNYVDNRPQLFLYTIGIGTFWKGPNILLKTANILKKYGVDFEWNVAGNIRPDIKRVVEKKEKMKFAENHIHILGQQNPNQIIDNLINCSLYIHCAYIDNSPNAICEAQYLGVPIISTNTGGIGSLINDGFSGILVPTNDPWRMAYEIITIRNDKDRLTHISKNAMSVARDRHSKKRITEELLSCYNSIIGIN